MTPKKANVIGSETRGAKLISKLKKELMQTLTRIAGDAIKKREAEGWTAKDISDVTGVAQNRITEIKYPERYKTAKGLPKAISEKNLTKLIGGGIVTVDTLRNEAAKHSTPEQLDHIEQYRTQ